MVIFCLVASLLAAAAGGAPQNKKNRDWLMLLPVQVKAELAAEEASTLRLLIRGQTVSEFEKKGIPTVSPAQMSLTEQELKVKLEALDGWDTEVIDKLVERWKPRYVAVVIIKELKSTEGAVSTPPGSPPPPGGVLITDAHLVGSLWDVKNKKFVFECVDSEVQLKMGRPGPSERQVTEQNTKAVMEASKNLFKEFLKKLPTPPPTIGIGG